MPLCVCVKRDPKAWHWLSAGVSTNHFIFVLPTAGCPMTVEAAYHCRPDRQVLRQCGGLNQDVNSAFS